VDNVGRDKGALDGVTVACIRAAKGVVVWQSAERYHGVRAHRPMHLATLGQVGNPAGDLARAEFQPVGDVRDRQATRGAPLGEHTRFAFSWSSSAAPNSIAMPGYPTSPYSTAFAAGVSTDVTEDWKVSLNAQTLHEEGGLLGTVYNSNGSLSLGNDHRSNEVGIGSAIALSDRAQFVLSAALADTAATNALPGLVQNVSALMERSMSATLATRDAIVEGDGLSLSLAKPLRVVSGSMGIETAGVNPDGTPFLAIKTVAAAPAGNETDLSLAYSAEPREGLRLSGTITAQNDANNIAGQRAAVVQLNARLLF